jgi:hypothetical protein
VTRPETEDTVDSPEVRAMLESVGASPKGPEWTEAKWSLVQSLATARTLGALEIAAHRLVCGEDLAKLFVAMRELVVAGSLMADAALRRANEALAMYEEAKGICEELALGGDLSEAVQLLKRAQKALAPLSAAEGEAMAELYLSVGWKETVPMSRETALARLDEMMFELEESDSGHEYRGPDPLFRCAQALFQELQGAGAPHFWWGAACEAAGVLVPSAPSRGWLLAWAATPDAPAALATRVRAFIARTGGVA